MARSFTQVFRSLVPWWLLEGDGERVLHSLAVVKDLLVKRARAGLNARFPRRAAKDSPSALALIAAERGILRGRFESDAAFAERLAKWRYPKQHRVRGNAYALLDQIAEYVGGAVVYSLDARNNRHVRGQSSVASPYQRDAEFVEYNYFLPLAFDSLNPVVNWARFFVVLCANPFLPWATETPALGDPALWGGKSGTPGYCIGLAGWTPTDTANIRKLFRGSQRWHPAGTRAEWLVIQLTDWNFAVTSDPSWERWGAIQLGTRYPQRSADYRYISLSPSINNAFTGDPAQWADDVQLLGGVPNYAGNPAVFSASVTLPNGSTYSGNPARFTGKIQLPDDGDQA